MYVLRLRCTSFARITLLLRASVPREAGMELVDCWGCDSGIRKAIPISYGAHKEWILIVISFCM